MHQNERQADGEACEVPGSLPFIGRGERHQYENKREHHLGAERRKQVARSIAVGSGLRSSHGNTATVNERIDNYRTHDSPCNRAAM